MKTLMIGAAFAAALLSISPASAQSPKAGLGTGPILTPSQRAAQEDWWERRAARKAHAAGATPPKETAANATKKPCACCDKPMMPGMAKDS
jgi:hypothetical protein